MAELPSTIVSQSENIIKQIAETADLNKLLKSKTFLGKLKQLPQAEQLQIFNTYKEQFIELSQNPQSAIAKWTGSFTQNLPDTDTIRKSLDYGIQFIQKFGKDSPSSPK